LLSLAFRHLFVGSFRIGIIDYVAYGDGVRDPLSIWTRRNETNCLRSSRAANWKRLPFDWTREDHRIWVLYFGDHFGPLDFQQRDDDLRGDPRTIGGDDSSHCFAIYNLTFCNHLHWIVSVRLHRWTTSRLRLVQFFLHRLAACNLFASLRCGTLLQHHSDTVLSIFAKIGNWIFWLLNDWFLFYFHFISFLLCNIIWMNFEFYAKFNCTLYI